MLMIHRYLFIIKVKRITLLNFSQPTNDSNVSNFS